MLRSLRGRVKEAVAAGIVRAAFAGAACLPFMLAACDAHGPSGDANANAPATQSGAQTAASVPAAVVPVAAHGGRQSRAEVYEAVRKMRGLGKQMFLDPRLSGPARLACAPCHSPAPP